MGYSDISHAICYLMAAGYVPQRELQLNGHERQANRRKIGKRALTTAAVARSQRPFSVRWTMP
jgi:hypothetical protein